MGFNSEIMEIQVAFHELFHVDRAATYKVDHFFFNAILQMGKLRHREVKQLAPDTQL